MEYATFMLKPEKEEKKMKVLVAYDGTLQAKDALRHGLKKATGDNDELIVFNAFGGNMFIDYDVSPNARERAWTDSRALAKEAEAIIRETGGGVKARIIQGENSPEEEIMDCARAEGADVLLCPPKFKSIIKKYRKTLTELGRQSVGEELFDETEKLEMESAGIKAV